MRYFCLPLALALLPLLEAPAACKSSVHLHYQRAQIFSSALRYLRLDLRYEVTERDSEAAYLLFKYEGLKKETAGRVGSIEIVETENGVQVRVQIDNVPTYRERMLRDGLLNKLTDDYGPAPHRSRKKPAAPEAKPKPKEKSAEGGNSGKK